MYQKWITCKIDNYGWLNVVHRVLVYLLKTTIKPFNQCDAPI